MLAGTLVLMAVRLNRPPWLFAAGLVFITVGIVGEYGFAGLATMITAHAWCERRSPWRLGLWVLSVAALVLANGDLWALLAVPMVLGARWVRLDLPRASVFFYAVYPLHLSLLWLWVALR
jgi:hypothetical protein